MTIVNQKDDLNEKYIKVYFIYQTFLLNYLKKFFVHINTF